MQHGAPVCSGTKQQIWQIHPSLSSIWTQPTTYEYSL